MNSSSCLRRQAILDGLAYCDNDKDRINILLDKIISLQTELFELSYRHNELLFRLSNPDLDVYSTDICSY